MLFVWNDVYSTAAGKESVSGSRRQLPDSVMNKRKKEMSNGIHAFVMLIIHAFRLPPYAAHARVIIYEHGEDMMHTIRPVTNDFTVKIILLS
jgi:hypothetical protein